MKAKYTLSPCSLSTHTHTNPSSVSSIFNSCVTPASLSYQHHGVNVRKSEKIRKQQIMLLFHLTWWQPKQAKSSPCQFSVTVAITALYYAGTTCLKSALDCFRIGITIQCALKTRRFDFGGFGATTPKVQRTCSEGFKVVLKKAIRCKMKNEQDCWCNPLKVGSGYQPNISWC